MPYDSLLRAGFWEATVALTAGTVFAGFTIEQTLGVGGMGTVYLARHPRLPRSDALKLLRPELSYDPDFAVRFAREADIVARLDHPNIVGVNDRGTEDGQLWISMPYIDGMDAEAALAEYRGPMPAARAIRIVSQIAAALDFAHRNGLWHRDVKPANILLAPGHDDEPERVWLTDFGIAKAADEALGLTKTGNVIATFDYAPPEQIEGRVFDHRVDIYALGCVLYKLLTGSVPYPGTTMAAALHGHLNLPPPRPTVRTPWLAPGLDDVIARAMAKDPDQRYPNCRALASAAQAARNALPDPPALPYSVSALRTDPGSGQPMILGPVDSGELSAADRNGLLGLVQRSRLFDLPASLLSANEAGDDAPTVPGDDSSRPTHTVTIVVRATGRTAIVSYVPAESARPPELDDLLRGLEIRRTWHPSSPDAQPAERSPAPPTAVEQRPPAPDIRPAIQPQANPPLATTGPGAVKAPPAGIGPPAPVPWPPRSEPARLAASARPARSRRALVAALVAGLLVVGAGVTAYVLITDDDPNAAGGGTPSAAPAGSEAENAAAEGGSGLPSSAALGLPSGPPLASTVLVANQQIDENIDLYVVDSVTGAAQTRLSSAPGADFGPVIAPDRTSVVYLRERGTGHELWVVATDGTGARALFAETPPGCDSVRRPAWNPADPTMLAVVCLDAAGTATLQLLTPWGDRIRTLETGLPQFDDVAFSPDGTTLVCWANADPAAGDGPLYALAADGSAPPVQLTDDGLAGSADPIWSPDGTQIAFRAQVPDAGGNANQEILVMNADGSDPQVRAPDAGIDQDPVWSPDGSMIAFKSNRADGATVGPDRLWIMNTDGSNPRLLTPGTVVDGFAPAWSNR